MLGRRSVVLAGLTLGLVVGCGPVIRTKWKVERGLARAETALTPNKLDYTVYQPTHRVALATWETLKADLAEARVVRVELTRDHHFDTSEGKTPAPEAVTIPPGHHACWVESPALAKEPILANCQLVSFEGKTKDGQAVEVEVRLEIVGSDQRTVAGVQVGGRGDSSNSRLLIARISERLVNLAPRPNSPEERAAVRTMFDLGPKARVEAPPGKDEITIQG